jgi:hypothetical protein
MFRVLPGASETPAKEILESASRLMSEVKELKLVGVGATGA